MESWITLLMPIILAIFGSSGFWAYLQSKKDNSKTILEQIKKINERLGKLEQTNDEKEALNWRNQIVRFSDEIRTGRQHSKDGYDHILIIIDKYLKYCSENKGVFVNSIAEISIKKIKEHYAKDDFYNKKSPGKQLKPWAFSFEKYSAMIAMFHRFFIITFNI